MNEVKNIPRLRFNHFDEEWTLSKVFETGKILTGSTPPTNNPEYYDGNFLFVSPSDLGSRKYISNTSKRVSKLGLETGRVIPKNSIMFVGIGSTIGKVGVSTEPCITNQQIHSIIPNPKFKADFVYYILKKNKAKIRLLAGTQAVPQLNKTDFSKLNYYFPSLPEQQKIADFLTAVDKRIDLLEKKKTLLETYKKGVMKKIFGQEIRFKDDNGSNFPDWEEKSLGDIGEFKTSSVDKKSDDNEQEVFLVNYMNVYRHEKITNENKHDLMVVTAKPHQIDSNNLLKGDILFTPSSETPDDIGHSVVIFEDLDDTLYSYHLLRFRPTIKIDILYSHYFCNNDLVLNQICRFATGSTRFTISKDSFSKILINLPCVDEQSKIARFLDSIDKQLELLESQIDKSKTWKKGLLQKMFV